MARNIEIKAKAQDFAAQSAAARHIADSGPTTLVQEDTFFTVPQGRLKLREFPDAAAQLIYYNRDDSSAPKMSDYHISETEDGCGLKSVLEMAYGIRHVVRKTRVLYLVGRTRIHLDQVEGLGEYIELEVVLTDDESPETGRLEAVALMQKLNIDETDLIKTAYVDLLEKQQ